MIGMTKQAAIDLILSRSDLSSVEIFRLFPDYFPGGRDRHSNFNYIRERRRHLGIPRTTDRDTSSSNHGQKPADKAGKQHLAAAHQPRRGEATDTHRSNSTPERPHAGAEGRRKKQGRPRDGRKRTAGIDGIRRGRETRDIILSNPRAFPAGADGAAMRYVQRLRKEGKRQSVVVAGGGTGATMKGRDCTRDSSRARQSITNRAR